jgi:GNAT superfamily N-acetyltransferase
MNPLGTITSSDGALLTVRPIGPTDIARLERMFFRLSPATVYRRFFSPIHEPSPRMLMWLTNVDHDRREALVAVHGDEIVAVARYDGRPGSTEAEIAVTVEDAWQHRGIGGRLARRLAAVALDHGFEQFIATMLPDNREAIGLLHRLSADASVRFSDGTYAAVAPLSRAS